jgi:hypothetical protein
MLWTSLRESGKREQVMVYNKLGQLVTKGKYQEVAWIEPPLSPEGKPVYKTMLALVEIDPGNIYDERVRLTDVAFVKEISADMIDIAKKVQVSVTGRVPTYPWNIVKGLKPVKFPVGER